MRLSFCLFSGCREAMVHARRGCLAELCHHPSGTDTAALIWRRQGKRGACIGVFQQIIAGHEPKESLREVLAILKNTSNPQVEYIMRTMKRWAKDNRVVV